MPKNFQVRHRVYAFARRWRMKGPLAELHDRLRRLVRDAEVRAPEPTAAIVDAQSLRAAPSAPRSTSGRDGGKKVGGRKRHIVVGSLRPLLAVMVTAASVQDRDATQPLLERLRDRFHKITLVWADGG